jgi:hypothetical protein
MPAILLGSKISQRRLRRTDTSQKITPVPKSLSGCYGARAPGEDALAVGKISVIASLKKA